VVLSTPDDVESSHDHEHHHEGPGYSTPQAAIEESGREQLAYVMSLYVGTDVDAPDFVSVVDLDPDSTRTARSSTESNCRIAATNSTTSGGTPVRRRVTSRASSGDT